uniref:Single domain-containing protein n=1 Tax=Glossina brevipalpis TaxID=37001 RepID=A0A1A9WWN5_9MUSC
MLKYLLYLIVIFKTIQGFGQFHLKQYTAPVDSSENDNSVLRTYRRCMWEQSKFLPRRLVLLSLCSNLFCENNQIMQRSSCLDILPEQCEQGDEEELMYKPFPDCCPVYCNLKKRMQRLKTMHFRHRMLLNMQRQQAAGGTNMLLNEYGLGNF